MLQFSSLIQKENATVKKKIQSSVHSRGKNPQCLCIAVATSCWDSSGDS